MKNEQYAQMVNQGEFPTEIAVPLDSPFIDSRGMIQNLWLAPCGSVSLIESKEGSIRARHRHTEGDWHSCYMVSGKVQYIEKDDGGKIIHDQIYRGGTAFFTKPNVWHQMTFLQDSLMITMNGIVKSHTNYERSIRREDL